MDLELVELNMNESGRTGPQRCSPSLRAVIRMDHWSAPSTSHLPSDPPSPSFHLQEGLLRILPTDVEVPLSPYVLSFALPLFIIISLYVLRKLQVVSVKHSVTLPKPPGTKVLKSGGDTASRV
ncbi:hypothetical protein BDW59DRAFT_152637 [Aspergillus cavernicola]|uniref:Uncharacterized protein n=1 Tax=Aspergillus cavernicola TaxID=176166 RepID=A0ABR4HRQ7_9EURO